MQVKEIMTKNPACCMPDTNLQEVSKMMVENDCGCIPIVENMTNMKPVGTVTDRDVTIRTVAAGKNPLDLTASDIMSTDVITINKGADINECSRLMKDNDIRRVLVVDKNGKCCGIVAQADIAEYGPNPSLIGDVVHDISESAHTPVKSSSSKKKGEKTTKSKSSILSLNSVVPLAVGVAAGAAYKYFYSSDNKAETKNNEKTEDIQLKDKAPKPIEVVKTTSVENKTVEPKAENNVLESSKKFATEMPVNKTNPEIGRAANQK